MACRFPGVAVLAVHWHTAHESFASKCTVHLGGSDRRSSAPGNPPRRAQANSVQRSSETHAGTAAAAATRHPITPPPAHFSRSPPPTHTTQDPHHPHTTTRPPHHSPPT